MAYDKAKLESDSLAIIEEHNLKFVAHLIGFLPCSESTFYEIGLAESESIKKAINENRTNAKVRALHRWEKSNQPTLEIAFYKLIGSDEEADRLNGSKQKHEVTGKDGADLIPRQFTVEVVRNDNDGKPDKDSN